MQIRGRTNKQKIKTYNNYFNLYIGNKVEPKKNFQKTFNVVIFFLFHRQICQCLVKSGHTSNEYNYIQ